MRIMFVVQGEGRGHLTQAITLEQMLRSNGHEVVEVLVGKSKSRKLPDFFQREIHAPVHTFESPNFLPTAANKRSNVPRSVAYNICRLPVYLKSIHFLFNRIRNSKVDLVINFYELLIGLTYLLTNPGVPQLSIGHQYLFLHPDFRFPKGSPVSMFFLRLFTRLTCIGSQSKLALSFRQMPDDDLHSIKVVPPLIRREVRGCRVSDGDYLLGYLLNAGFSDMVMRWHSEHPEVKLLFFWDKKGMPEEYRVDETLTFHQIDDKSFVRAMAGCKAYATTAGFESVCEGLYLHKPILMVPAHIEQDCNAFDASLSGAGIVSHDFDLSRLLDFSRNYKPDTHFHSWENMGMAKIISIIEQTATVEMKHRLSLSSSLFDRLTSLLDA